MKAKELAEELLNHPDFDVKLIFAITDSCTPENHWPIYHTARIIGIGDIGYSSKELILEIDEV